MVKKSKYVCQECGHSSVQWMGKCPSCNSWNTFVEEMEEPATTSIRSNKFSGTEPQAMAQLKPQQEKRWTTGTTELDRVLGGGVVEGGFVLIGGDPGIGKSTLILQALDHLSKKKKVLYITGEESCEQVKLRAERLGIKGEALLLAAENSLEKIFAMAEKIKPDVLAIDSIQTMFTEEVQSAPGSVSQVREVGARLMQLAKGTGIFTILVGHVTKDGSIAGPRVLEHMVDTVLYFEAAASQPFRILRAVKNRFGSTNEIGVFEMTEGGLIEVKNPSAVFLAERPDAVPGSVAVSIMEGTRPLLIELQALVSRSFLAQPRRTVLGMDYNRAAVLFAVLEKKSDIVLYNQDIFINIVGGMRVQETSADLGVMAAVASSFFNKPIPKDVLMIGEVGLAGEVRAVSQAEARLSEAAKLGFRRCFLPKGNFDRLKKKEIECIPIRQANEIFNYFFR